VLAPGKENVGFGAAGAGAGVEVVFVAELPGVDEGAAPKILLVDVDFAPNRPDPVFADAPPNKPPTG
jgi:hypothetical protein